MPTVPEAVRPPVDIPPRADLGEWARIRARIAVTDRCWVYCGALSDDGYGRFWSATAAAGGKRSPVVRPSRWMWQAHHGPIPAGQVIRHDCDRSWCSRPACLRLGDQGDNLGDALRRDRLTHPGRVGKADRRGAAPAARAVRKAILAALGTGTNDPAALGAIVADVLAQGDPFAEHESLFAPDDLVPTAGTQPVTRSLGGSGSRSTRTRRPHKPHVDGDGFTSHDRLF